MKLIFTPQSWEDFEYWQDNDKRMSKRIRSLIKSIQRDPFEGTGKPELLKHNLRGFWSRRINEEYRLVYRVTEEAIEIVQARHHY